MSLELTTQAPFAEGGNRLCFVHPEFQDRVIKVRRPDRPLREKRRKKGFPKRLLPLSSFDDNIEEHQVMQGFEQRFGEPVFQVVARCFGFTATDLGPGLVSELVRDANNKISHTLKQIIWDEGLTEDCQRAIAAFAATWQQLAVPSRDLLLHNIVAQRNADGGIVRLVVIDGLGNQNLIPDAWRTTRQRRVKVAKKVSNFHERIELLLSQRGSGDFPGYHGLLLHDGDEPTTGSNP